MDKREGDAAQEFYRQLVARYAEGGATEEELEMFFQLLAEGRLDAHLVTAMNQFAGIAEADETATAPSRIRRLPRWTRIAAAAILILAAGVGLYTWLKPHPGRSLSNPQIMVIDRSPGTNKAILTLGNGQKIILDTAHNGQLARQSGAQIVKLDSGRLVYAATSGRPSQITFNTLTTPRGGQYQLTLPDGSRVWLDAASSITYPTAFTGKERKVSMTGQAYFEIVHRPGQPFVVNTENISLLDIGTAFNINAYADEPVAKITLTEGAIALKKRGHQLILSPGQQARSAGEEPLSLIRQADIEQTLAWKNGMIKLGGASIQEIMRQLARWYDVDVEFQGNLDQAVFSGIVSRRQNISGLIRILEATGSVHFSTDNKKIIVKP